MIHGALRSRRPSNSVRQDLFFPLKVVVIELPSLHNPPKTLFLLPNISLKNSATRVALPA
jgi:transcriptional regulator of acetoin/glycerol metabolism